MAPVVAWVMLVSTVPMQSVGVDDAGPAVMLAVTVMVPVASAVQPVVPFVYVYVIVCVPAPATDGSNRPADPSVIPVPMYVPPVGEPWVRLMADASTHNHIAQVATYLRL